MLKEMIERAEIKAGSQIKLGLIIDQAPSKIRAAKAGVCGLPTYACVMIAEMIGEEAETVIAASELTTEKKAERRAFWEKKLEALAASVLVSVILNMTPSPAQAAQTLQVADFTLYIMSNAKRIIRRVRGWLAGCTNKHSTIAATPSCCPG